jgi:hypothetical protein
VASCGSRRACVAHLERRRSQIQIGFGGLNDFVGGVENVIVWKEEETVGKFGESGSS